MFYDRGWSGINVEPNQAYHKILCNQRSRDINLWCALSDNKGQTDYYYVKEDPKISFIGDMQTTENPVYKNLTIEKRKVATTTLTDILKEHKITHIDFLKIDVEGAEHQVLKGIDLQSFRPRLMIIESVSVKEKEILSNQWAQLLEDQNYTKVYFDGANSYYVDSSDQEALQAYALPLNADDNFIQFRHTRPSFLLKKLLRLK